MSCEVEDCYSVQLARGYCNRHYKQFRSSGELPRTKHHEYHGMYGTPEYNSWGHIVSRCNNENDKRYADWGGRGIKICDGFRYSFMNFYDTVGKRPGGTSIDRINNDGHYSCGKCAHCKANKWPLNIRWSEASEQQVNKRKYKVNTSGHKNITWNKRNKKWAIVIQRVNKIIFSGYCDTLDGAVKIRNEQIMLYNNNHERKRYLDTQTSSL